MELESTSALNPSGLYYPRVSLQTTDERPYHGKAVMCRTQTHKYVKRLYEQDELYDLTNDPSEQYSLIDDPENASLLHQFNQMISDWYLETCDWVPPKPDKRGFIPSFFQWMKNLLIRRRKW
jgi:arylsulfatase A-like enzyme